MHPCQCRCRECKRCGGIPDCCGRGVGEKDECEAWRPDGDFAGVSDLITGDGGYIQFAFRQAVDLEFVSEGLLRA